MTKKTSEIFAVKMEFFPKKTSFKNLGPRNFFSPPPNSEPGLRLCRCRVRRASESGTSFQFSSSEEKPQLGRACYFVCMCKPVLQDVCKIYRPIVTNNLSLNIMGIVRN